MSELLQDDDPDPHPNFQHEYPVNWQTDLAYDDYESAEYYTEQQRISLERNAVACLSGQAARVIERYGTGDQTERVAVTDRAALNRVIKGGLWMYGLAETLEDGTQHRYVWRLGGDTVICCEDENYRYEPAEEVVSRLEGLFPVGEDIVRLKQSSRLRRILTTLALR